MLSFSILFFCDLKTFNVRLFVRECWVKELSLYA